MKRPLHTYRQNIEGTVSVLEAMVAAGVGSIVFSSSAAVFGTPDDELVTEDSATRPESPYGRSKLVSEWVIADAAVAHGIRHTSLRYFNVVGSGHDDLYDTSPHNLFPLVLKALTEGRTPVIRGDDYPTPDGTCVRDYLHVQDLALAHVEAARRLDAGDDLEPVYNLGSGDGLSVRQVMDAVARVTGEPFDPVIEPRRRRRPGPDRGARRPRRPRPGLDDAARRRPDGRQRLAGVEGLAGRLTAGTARRRSRGRSADLAGAALEQRDQGAVAPRAPPAPG